MPESKNSFDAEKIVDQIKELVKKGNVSKIIVKHDEDTILALRRHRGQSSPRQSLPSVSNAASNCSKMMVKLWR